MSHLELQTYPAYPHFNSKLVIWLRSQLMMGSVKPVHRLRVHAFRATHWQAPTLASPSVLRHCCSVSLLSAPGMFSQCAIASRMYHAPRGVRFPLTAPLSSPSTPHSDFPTSVPYCCSHNSLPRPPKSTTPQPHMRSPQQNHQVSASPSYLPISTVHKHPVLTPSTATLTYHQDMHTADCAPTAPR